MFSDMLFYDSHSNNKMEVKKINGMKEIDQTFTSINVLGDKDPVYSNILLKTYPIEPIHHSIGQTLGIGQLFGILPVSGVMAKDPLSLRFKWKSWQVVYSILMMIGSANLTIISIIFMGYEKFSVDNAGMFIFYGSAFTVQLLFFNLALKWSEIMAEITRVEKISSLTPFINSTTDKARSYKLKTIFNLWTFLILSLAFVEHSLCIVAGVTNAFNCRPDIPVMQGHYISAFPQVFYFTEYSLWKALLLQVVNLAATFAWNFMDLFVLLVSVGLFNHFNILNSKLNQTMGNNQSMHFWSLARNEYAHLCQLVLYIDHQISSIILLSFSENLYIICKQLFNTLKADKSDPNSCWLRSDGLFGGWISNIYFGFSFTFLVCRFTAVAMSAAEVHRASKKPLGPLYYVSDSCYNLEVTRFLDHVTSDNISLSGLNIFHVTRTLILTIVSTIVTYELVMVQFYMPQAPCLAMNITKEN